MSKKKPEATTSKYQNLVVFTDACTRPARQTLFAILPLFWISGIFPINGSEASENAAHNDSIAAETLNGMPTTVIADFVDDFPNASGDGFQFAEANMSPGWEYLWNPSGTIPNSENYVPLAANTIDPDKTFWDDGIFTADDSISFSDEGQEDFQYGRVGPAVQAMHPGNGADGDFRAIAAYTIQGGESGTVSITNSFIQRANSGQEVVLDVYVNDALQWSTSSTGQSVNFDGDLGALAVGDTVYVKLGAGSDGAGADASTLDFTLESIVGQNNILSITASSTNLPYIDDAAELTISFDPLADSATLTTPTGIVDLLAIDAVDSSPQDGEVVYSDTPSMDYTYIVEVTINSLTQNAQESVFVTRNYAASTEIYNTPKPRYNVLFIIADDLNCDLGTYDHPLVQSPNIDALAASGRQFNRAYCQYPVCWPSRKSFMTGLYPDPINAQIKNDPVRNQNPRTVTMSQHFMASGYQVDRVGKIYHYDVPRGIGGAGSDDPQSWLRWYAPTGRDRAIEDDIVRVSSLNPDVNYSGGLGAQLSWLSDEHDGGESDLEHTDGLVVLQANSLLSEYANNDSAFFLAVGLFRPHTPFVAPSQYTDLYDLDDIVVPTVPANYFDGIPSKAVNYLSAIRSDNNLDPAVAKQAIQAYYASISFVDANVGRMLDQLDTLGLRDSTIVVFTSDHGFHMGEHGHYQKNTLYENATRVPFIISMPEQASAGDKTDAYAEMIDLYRTLSDLAGLPEPFFPKGMSLEPIMENPNVSVRDSALSQIGSDFSIRSGQWRYTKYSNNAIELYDHTNDPEELINLAGDSNYASVIAELDTELQLRIADAQEAKPYPSNGREPYLGRPIELPGLLQAEYFDYGGQGLSWNDTTAGGDMWRDTDVDLEPTDDGTFHIGSTEDGEWLEYTVDLTSGTYDLTMRSASSQPSPGQVNIYVENQFIGTIQSAPTGDSNTYTETSIASIPIVGAGANSRVRLEIDLSTGGTDSFNIDWIRFDLKQINFLQWTGNYDGWSTIPVDMNADEDGDGFNNKLEFLFGGNPFDPRSRPAKTYFYDYQNNQFTASIFAQKSADEGSFRWEWTRDLLSDDWLTSGFSQDDFDIPNGMTRSQFSIDSSAEDQVFLRALFE
ncbi:MAG: sulfatase-like hydrolase/transferase [Verrucomicrobiota bacterium]